MNNYLTYQQAYAAMYVFLEDYYKRGNSDEIGTLLGALSLLENGEPVDSAMKNDWISAINKSLSDKGRISLKLFNKE